MSNPYSMIETQKFDSKSTIQAPNSVLGQLAVEIDPTTGTFNLMKYVEYDTNNAGPVDFAIGDVTSFMNITLTMVNVDVSDVIANSTLISPTYAGVSRIAIDSSEESAAFGWIQVTGRATGVTAATVAVGVPIAVDVATDASCDDFADHYTTTAATIAQIAAGQKAYCGLCLAGTTSITAQLHSNIIT